MSVNIGFSQIYDGVIIPRVDEFVGEVIPQLAGACDEVVGEAIPQLDGAYDEVVGEKRKRAKVVFVGDNEVEQITCLDGWKYSKKNKMKNVKVDIEKLDIRKFQFSRLDIEEINRVEKLQEEKRQCRSRDSVGRTSPSELEAAEQMLRDKRREERQKLGGAEPKYKRQSGRKFRKRGKGKNARVAQKKAWNIKMDTYVGNGMPCVVEGCDRIFLRRSSMYKHIREFHVDRRGMSGEEAESYLAKIPSRQDSVEQNRARLEESREVVEMEEERVEEIEKLLRWEKLE